MDNPLLSICIPTYNRADCLKQCLNSIVSQFSNPEIYSQVEIVISDNNSADNTELVVKQFQSMYHGIFYKKNIDNLGVDRNILQVVEMSSGKFVWLLGDDDALFPGILLYIIKVLQNEKADYFITNCWGYNNSLTEKAVNKPNFIFSEDQNYNSLYNFVITTKPGKGLVGLFCGLSMQLFLKDTWSAYVNKEQFIGTSAIHLHILMSVMKNRKFSLLAKPCVMVRASNIRWDVFEGLGTFKKRTCAP